MLRFRATSTKAVISFIATKETVIFFKYPVEMIYFKLNFKHNYMLPFPNT